MAKSKKRTPSKGESEAIKKSLADNRRFPASAYRKVKSNKKYPNPA